ncbi:hypothetical protein [Bacillus suaedaesalsae]|uniref:Uncharacterized protein n=1 Tax=Bacillus suaedaesalsae TaxID=2810349 RepID=A0ABS2DG60_9BACI|nr:hypothetical protein [Bacillus suaedaesalsae]MBM6617467.1 hypothetical protein [Bacillus suaedaesalsae]
MKEKETTFYIPPKGAFEEFQDEDHYAEKVREWGLCTTKEVKKEFWYKDRIHQRQVTIKGYEVFGDTLEQNTIVIEFQDGNLSCIHPAYLKEMQTSSFGKELIKLDEDAIDKSDQPTIKEKQKKSTSTNETKQVTKVKKEKPAKLVLPEEKVHFTAKVKQLALSWNHFNEENDEVIVLEDVRIEQDEPIEVGLAWCSHSKTLKKFELTTGQEIEFDGKIVKKSLPKGKDVEDESLLLDVSVGYKVNNPSKIVKK